MEVVGGISAVLSLAATAAKLSKSVAELSSQYSNSAFQIRSFGSEINIFEGILKQLHRLISAPGFELEADVEVVTNSILDECDSFFCQLEEFQKKLSSTGIPDKSFRSRIKWTFKSGDLDFYRARLEGMKTNLLLMMTMQVSMKVQRY